MQCCQRRYSCLIPYRSLLFHTPAHPGSLQSPCEPSSPCHYPQGMLQHCRRGRERGQDETAMVRGEFYGYIPWRPVASAHPLLRGEGTASVATHVAQPYSCRIVNDGGLDGPDRLRRHRRCHQERRRCTRAMNCCTA